METFAIINKIKRGKSSVPLSISTSLSLGRFSFRYSSRELGVAIVLFGLLMLLALYATTVGKFPITFNQIIDILAGVSDSGVKERVLMNIRMPRIVTAVFSGAALGVSGAIFQSVSRNALGSPDVIGFTAGAATGALTQIILFQPSAFQISLAAIIGGLLTAMLVYLLSLKSGTVGRYRLILIGIGIGSVLSALNGLLLVKGNLDNAVTANLWLSGSLNARNWTHALPVLIGVLVLLPFVKLLSRSLMMIEMGDHLATQLGVNIERVRLQMILYAVVLAALATGATGPIAFIALAAPQLTRRLRKSSNIPIFSAAFMGAMLLISADLFTQLVPLQITLPIGRITGIVGGIYLIWLLTRTRY